MRRKPGQESRRVGLFSLLIPILGLLLLATAGCWDHLEMPDVAWILGMGIDLGSKPGWYRVTAMVINTRTTFGPVGPQGSATEPANFVVSAEAPSLLEASRLLTARLGRRAYYVFADVIIIAGDVAKQGIAPLEDFFSRDRQFRRAQRFLVAKGLASDILDVRGTVEERPSILITKALDHAGQTGLSEMVTKGQFEQMMSNPGQDPVLPVVERVPTESQNVGRFSATLPELGGTPAEPSSPPEPEGVPPESPSSPIMEGGVRSTLQVTGLAAFRNDELVGFFDGDETYGLVALRRGFNNTPLTVTLPPDQTPPLVRIAPPSLPPGKGSSTQYHSVPATPPGSSTRPPAGRLSALLFASAPQIQPLVTPSGGLRFRVILQVNATLTEVWGGYDLLNTEVLNKVKRSIEQEIRRRIQVALDRCAKLQVDPVGFGLKLYRSHPQRWSEVQQHWPQLLASTPIDIRVELRTLNPGLSVGVPMHGRRGTEGSNLRR
ncbi:MAG TPA: hypothetical protein GXX55_06935 [Firmicutes bacterium]|nr:hypothetical protein [Bacillota bacterium]